MDLSPLRNSIHKLQKASFELDEEKAKAEKNFRELLKKIKGLMGDCPHFGNRKLGWFEGAYEKVKKLLGYPEAEPRKAGPNQSHWDHLDLFITDVFSSGSMSTELFDKEHSPSELKKFPIRKFIKAAKRVQRANKKLAKFEQGFISKEGIKDREWYKHLGVAPGKNLGEICCWCSFRNFVDKLILGYGATTLPALTEALTIEKNTTLEAKRLKTLLDKLAKEIEV